MSGLTNRISHDTAQVCRECDVMLDEHAPAVLQITSGNSCISSTPQ